MDYQRVNILGVGVSAIHMGQALAVLEEWIEKRNQQYVCVTPAHAVMDCYHDPRLRAIFNASGLTTPDGMAIVWLLKLHGQRSVGRVYGPDLMREVCKFSVAKGWRHFLYGGEVGVLERLKSRLEAEYLGIQIVGTFSPPFRSLAEQEDQEIVDKINSARPDIIWVGISTPKQVQWMHDHLGKVNASVLIGVGAAFDFLSGRKPQAPRWVQRSGLEWLFRLISEPRRLWRRYAQYPLFVVLVLAQMLGLKRFPLDSVEVSENA
jgi:N-acetylglucosaminyldiphosphoundecaprenol N-acetyl-beta-D-mannosaminyltransferase